MPREQQVRDAVERFITRVRQDTDARLETLASDLLDIVDANSMGGRVEVERVAVEVARSVAKGGAQARHDLIARVVTAVRRLDEATTLRGILDALAEGASTEALRVAVLLVDAERLCSYRHHGFGPETAPADMAIDVSPLLTNVITFRQAATVPSAGLRLDPQTPPFMRVAAGRMGLAIPVVVARQVVAVVYAEGPERQPGEPGEPVWTEQVEVLVRHTSARLENVTSLRTVEVLSNPS